MPLSNSVGLCRFGKMYQKVKDVTFMKTAFLILLNVKKKKPKLERKEICEN